MSIEYLLSELDKQTKFKGNLKDDALLYLLQDGVDYALDILKLAKAINAKISIETEGLAKGGINDDSGTGTINVPKATKEQVIDGKSDDVAVTPASLAAKLEVVVKNATEDEAGITETATQEETDAGLDHFRYITPKTLTNSQQLKDIIEQLNTLDQEVKAFLSDAVPVGLIASWPLPTKPDGVFWDICDGDDFDKAANPKMAILYPSGKKPDLRGRVIEYYKSDAEGAVGSLQAGSIGEHTHDNTHGHSAEQDEHNHPSKPGQRLPVDGLPHGDNVDISSSSTSGHYVDLGDAFEPAKPDVRVESHSGNTGLSGSGRNTVDRYIGVAVIRMG